jgi:hypothetical protein
MCGTYQQQRLQVEGFAILHPVLNAKDYRQVQHGQHGEHRGPAVVERNGITLPMKVVPQTHVVCVCSVSSEILLELWSSSGTVGASIKQQQINTQHTIHTIHNTEVVFATNTESNPTKVSI